MTSPAEGIDHARMNKIFWILFVSLCVSAQTRAETQEADPQSFAGKRVMNGMRLEDFKDFEKTWHFVTVRFRKDTNEMRITYANDAAWEALAKGGTEYPKGAVFAKIGIATKEDPAFTSSAVPNGARRFQFMVRDPSEKFKSTDGWAYGLFDANGGTFPEDPEHTSQACAACHRLVPERGYVFSQAMVKSPFLLGAPEKPHPVTETNNVKFIDQALSALPAKVAQAFPKGTASVRMLEGPIRKHLFQGTLDEVRPILASEVVKSGKPAILMSEDGRRYSIVHEEANEACGKYAALKGVANIYFKKDDKYEVSFCHPR